VQDYQPLAEQARRLKDLLAKQARRAFVLELTGTPKAGKTSTIRLLETFFKTCGWRVHVVKERAAECPIPMKGHFFFNTWTTCTMMSEVLETADREHDLLIVDRGFFDALVWLELQRSRHQVDETEARIFEEFVTLERWRKLVDLTIVLSVSPSTAIEREAHDRMLPRRGSLMNVSSLLSFNSALDLARARYGKHFKLLEASSEAGDAKDVAANVIATVIAQIEPWVDAEVAVVPRSTIEKLTSNSVAVRYPSGWAELEASVQYISRSSAERDPSVVQLVANGVPTRDGGVFVFDRGSDPKRAGEYGQHAVLRGAHIESKARPLVNAARETVVSRFREDLHLNFEFEPEPLGFVWLPDGAPRLAQHAGLVFRVRIDDEAVAQSLEEKEFKTSGRGHPMTSSFATLEGLDQVQLEPWSGKVHSENWLKSPQ
jgi:thymidylate kinase